MSEKILSDTGFTPPKLQATPDCEHSNIDLFQVNATRTHQKQVVAGGAMCGRMWSENTSDLERNSFRSFCRSYSRSADLRDRADLRESRNHRRRPVRTSMDAGIVAAVAVNIVLLTVVLIQLAKVSRQVEASDAALADMPRLQELALAQANEQADVGAGMARNQAHLRGSLRNLCARTDELCCRVRVFEAGIERLEGKCDSFAAVCTGIWNNQSPLLPMSPSTPQRSSDDAYPTMDALSLSAQSLNVRLPPKTPTASAARGEMRVTPSDAGLGAQPPTPIRSPMQRRPSAPAASGDADGASSKSTFEAQRQLGQVARTLSAPVGQEDFREDNQAGPIPRDTSRPVHSSKGRSVTSRAGERERSTVLRRSTGPRA